jgi:hypothetical protein
MSKTEDQIISQVPMYGALTGVTLSVENFEMLPGLLLRRNFVDMFGIPMMAFSSPPQPNTPHPAPWVSVKGGSSFQSRVEASVGAANILGDTPPSTVLWFVAALLRLQLNVPVRMAALSGAHMDQSNAKSNNISAIEFESAPHQLGQYSGNWHELTEHDLDWLRTYLPIISRLYQEERFFRAFSVYEQAQWSPTTEMAAVLIWTAMEALFDLGQEQRKTKAICEVLSGYIGQDQADRDRAYQVIKELYFKRGRIVHVGRSIDAGDFAQSLQLAKVAFRRVLIDEALPPVRS